MADNLDHQIAGLARLSSPQLRAAYAELFGEMPRSRHRAWLVRRIAWRRQAAAEGDLSERARRRAVELANDADLRMLAPRPRKEPAVSPGATTKTVAEVRPDPRLPPVGTTINRLYKGQNVAVRVLEEGFEYEGAVYKSLSATARAITGQHCNGFSFFRLRKEITP